MYSLKRQTYNYYLKTIKDWIWIFGWIKLTSNNIHTPISNASENTISYIEKLVSFTIEMSNII